MLEIKGDIFDQHDADAICVTTNGVIKANGELVMGAGLAKQFAEKYPELPRLLAEGIRRYHRALAGFETTCAPYHSEVQVMYTWSFDGGWEANAEELGQPINPLWNVPQPHVVAFPTKEHWKDSSTLELIERSAQQLERMANSHGWTKVVLTRPGCGLGGLKWPEVKAVLEPILDDRFYIIS